MIHYKIYFFSISLLNSFRNQRIETREFSEKKMKKRFSRYKKRIKLNNYFD